MLDLLSIKNGGQKTKSQMALNIQAVCANSDINPVLGKSNHFLLKHYLNL